MRALGGGGHARTGGKAVGSPGVVSGNLVQVPVDVPVNVSGNSVNVIGLLNPAFGNVAVNG
ncbi:chaplin [Streptomyces viridosporus]|uniref:chaplin n=1 Tax=Streptomyces viridosporus TaxID=67581 RepID=UPI0009C102A7|nr:chaplin [Streptomyces viridosporus]